MIFLNLNDNIEYQFDCTQKYYNLRDSGFFDDYYCEKEGFFAVNSISKALLISDLALEDDNNLTIHFYLGTNESLKSRFFISFGRPILYETDVDFNPMTLRLDTNKIITNTDQTFHLNDITLNSITYRPVLGIIPGNPDIDSIYYNSSKGLLKLVSAKYGLNLILVR